MQILVIGDSHIDDRQNLDRFTALGKFIIDKQPEYIVSIGDFITLNCLSAWDRDNRATLENQRYYKEILAGNKAMDMLEYPLHKYNKGKRRGKYKPKKYYLMGNHEDRLTRYLIKDPTFEKQVSIEANLNLKKRGWRVVPYKSHIDIYGMSFTHIPITGNGSPISGVNVCRKALNLYSNSVIFGHTHQFNVENMFRHGAKHLIQALNVGCFFEHTDPYAEGAVTHYWRGIIMLNCTKKGQFDLETISLPYLKKEYL